MSESTKKLLEMSYDFNFTTFIESYQKEKSPDLKLGFELMFRDYLLSVKDSFYREDLDYQLDITLILILETVESIEEKVNLLIDLILLPTKDFDFWNEEIERKIINILGNNVLDFSLFSDKLEKKFSKVHDIDFSFVYNFYSDNLENIDFLVEKRLLLIDSKMSEKDVSKGHGNFHAFKFEANTEFLFEEALPYSFVFPVFSKKT